jgi:hypothetical protein
VHRNASRIDISFTRSGVLEPADPLFLQAYRLVNGSHLSMSLAVRMIMDKKKFIISAFLLLGILAACSGGTTTTPSTARTVPKPVHAPPVPVKSPLVGSYTTIITQKDGTLMITSPAVIAPGSAGSVALGGWLIAFNSDGYYTAQGPNSNASDQYAGLGQYTVTANLLSISDAKCWEFDGPQARTATYRWTLQGQMLRLNVVGNDLCSARSILLTSHPLRRER